MNCPECQSELEFVSGTYYTGVVAPDGYRESLWGEGFHCARCNYTYDANELDSLIAEGDDDPKLTWPA